MRSHGETKWMSRGRQEKRVGTQYIHFRESCLRAYDKEQDTNTAYAEGEEFDFKRLKMDEKTLLILTEEEKEQLKEFGIDIA